MFDISFNFIKKIKRNLFPFYKNKELKFVFNKLQEGFSKDKVLQLDLLEVVLENIYLMMKLMILILQQY